MYFKYYFLSLDAPSVTTIVCRNRSTPMAISERVQSPHPTSEILYQVLFYTTVPHKTKHHGGTTNCKLQTTGGVFNHASDAQSALR